RPADYDTGQDSIVRVKASEVRRRLAQYYDLSSDESMRIELPSGSYAPRFHGEPAAAASAEILAPVEEVQSKPRKHTRHWWFAVLVVPVVFAAVLAVRSFRPTQFELLWQPFFKGGPGPI